MKTGPVELDRAALLAELPAEETISVRLDPMLSLLIDATPVGRPARESPDVVVFRRGQKVTARIAGPGERLDLLEALLGGQASDDLPATLLPRDLDRFDQLVRSRSEAVSGLLAEGRRLVEEVERLVCALYEVPDDLTEEVVAHAVRRAGSAT